LRPHQPEQTRRHERDDNDHRQYRANVPAIALPRRRYRGVCSIVR
jgi:hypothetical protein